MKKTILTFAALILIAAPALADMETDLGLAIDVTGDAVPAGSYAKHISITTAQAFDLIAVTPDYGSSVLLSTPYLSVFNPTGWTLLPGATSTLAAAQGTPLTYGSDSSQRWTESFNIELLPSGDPSYRPHEGDAFIVAVWGAAPNPVGEWEYQTQKVSYGFGVWHVENLVETTEWNITRDQIIHVPAPAAIGLGMLGLGLIGWYMRRFA
jgi:hypothetical protein